MSVDEHSLMFPDGFIWGVATAAYQVEGNNTNCQWYEWEQMGNIASGERAGEACDWWGAAENDFDRAASLHLNGLRLSLEWSRIEPEPGRYSDTAIARYRQLLQALRERGIEPLVTLHHFTNPLWLERMGAFEHDRVAPLFASYTRFCVEQLGDLCDFWCTVNEPNTYAVAGYLLGAWPPGHKGDVRNYFVVQANLLRAHAAAYQTIHETQAHARVGLAHNVLLFDPLEPSSRLDWLAATGQDASFNGLVLEALAYGQAPLICRPFVGDLSAVRDTCDYLGLNYYTRHMVAFDPRNPAALFTRHLALPGAERMEPVPNLAAGETFGEIYPEGLHRALQRLSSYGKPIYVTENGFADGMDTQRPRALVRTLEALHAAIDDGAPVRGYFHWTLVDNFEWAEGWSMHFGLYSLDRATQTRLPRPSAEVYSRIAHANAVPTELLLRFREPVGSAGEGQLALGKN
jgi:beta-glucosidase